MTVSPGRKNCHTDMPAARITVSSDLRLRLSRAPILPTSTANAISSSVNAGSRSNPIHNSVVEGQFLRPPRHAQQLDHVDHEDQAGADHEGADDAEQEALGNVATQRSPQKGLTPS